MRFADARFSASIMISCSMIASLIGLVVGLHDETVRAARALLGTEVDLSRGEATQLRLAERDPQAVGDLAASAGWMVPVNSIIRFFVMISTAPPLFSPWPRAAVTALGVLARAVPLDVALLAALDAERAGRHVLRDHRSRSRHGALAHA